MAQYWREQEWITAYGVPRYGTCGSNALASAESWGDQRYVSTLTLYQRMTTAGRLTDPSGACNIWQIATQAAADGFRMVMIGYTPTVITGWQQQFEAWINQGAAIVMETNNGQVLTDMIGGKGENAVNLKNHFITLLMRHPVQGYNTYAQRDLPPGFFAADGDNYAVGDVLQFYSDETLAASMPCAACAVFARVAIPAGGSTMTLPSNYTEANGVITCTDNGFTIARGILNAWMQNPGKYGRPLENEHSVVPNVATEQTFELWLTGMRLENGTWTYLEDAAGYRVIQLAQQLVTQATTAQQANDALAQANATIATLRNQLAQALGANPAPAADPVLADKAARFDAIKNALA